MEPLIVAAIGAIGGLASGIVVALVKPVGEDWQERRRERRKRQLEDLDRLADLVRMRVGDGGHLLRMGAASTGDEDLIAYVGRLIAAPTEEERSAARGDASNRIGELRAKL